MDGGNYFDDDLDELPLADPPPRRPATASSQPTLHTPSGGALIASRSPPIAAVVASQPVYVPPPPALSRVPSISRPAPVIVLDDADVLVTPSRKVKQVVELDITEDVPTRRLVEVFDDLPLSHTPPKQLSTPTRPLVNAPSTPVRTPQPALHGPILASHPKLASPARQLSAPTVVTPPAAAVRAPSVVPTTPIAAKNPPHHRAHIPAVALPLDVPPSIASVVANILSEPSPLRALSVPMAEPPQFASLDLQDLHAPKRGGYLCRQCGQPKRGHVCSATSDLSLPPVPKAKKRKSNSIAASALAPPMGIAYGAYSQPFPVASAPVSTYVAPLPSAVARRISAPAVPYSQPAASYAPQAIRVHTLPAVPYAIPAAAAVGPKRIKSAEVDEEEERLAPWKSKANSAIRDRIERAINQRMYLITRSANANGLEQIFSVLGSIGNVYTIKICRTPTCSCPDFEKGNLCKHILFVYLKVLRVNSGSPLIYQRALLTKELRDIFRSAPQDPARSVLADEAVRRRFTEINSATVEVARKPIGEHCPVCYEEMLQRQNLVWCKYSCGNNMHAQCFQEWSKSKQAERSTVTCVLCRAPWPQSDGRAPRPLPLGEEGYVNLGSLQHDLPAERPDFHDWRANYYR